MKTRFFSFGCSFTSYCWPTWADIVGREFDYFENWGHQGAGNHYIFYTLMECINRSKIGKYDTVGIMWSSTHREDRYLKGKWYTPGSIFCAPYPKEYVDNYCDSNHYLLTAACLIDAAKRILDSIGCRYWFFSMVPITDEYDPASYKILHYMPSFESDVLEMFHPALKSIGPSVFEVIFHNSWDSLDHIKIPMIQKEIEKMFRADFEKLSRSGWPTFDNFMNDKVDDIDPQILESMNHEHGLIKRRTEVLSKRHEPHPTPVEHAQYLEYHGFQLSPNQRDFVDYWQERVLTKEKFIWMSQPFKRF